MKMKLLFCQTVLSGLGYCYAQLSGTAKERNQSINLGAPIAKAIVYGVLLLTGWPLFLAAANGNAEKVTQKETYVQKYSWDHPVSAAPAYSRESVKAGVSILVSKNDKYSPKQWEAFIQKQAAKINIPAKGFAIRDPEADHTVLALYIDGMCMGVYAVTDKDMKKLFKDMDDWIGAELDLLKEESAAK